MEWFRNLRIGVKLLSGFLLVAFIGIGVGVFAVSKMTVIEEGGQEMYEKMTVPLANAGSLLNHFQRMRANMLEMMAVDSLEKKAAYAEKVKERRASIAENQKLMEAVMDSPEEKALLGEYQNQRQIFGPLVDKFVSLSLSGQGRRGESPVHGGAGVQTRGLPGSRWTTSSLIT